MAKTTQTVDTTTSATETKTVLTEDAKRQKRNEYARAYYQAHKEQMKAAVKKCQAKKTESRKPAAKGKAHHAICQAKKACKATPEQKHLAKLQKLLNTSESKYLVIKEKLAAQKAEIARIKGEVKEAKALVKACKAANKAMNADHRKQRGRTAPNAAQQA